MLFSLKFKVTLLGLVYSIKIADYDKITDMSQNIQE